MQESRVSRLPRIPAGSKAMLMLMSSQETLPAAEEGATVLSSLLLVLLHQRRFSTDWWKAKQRRQTAVFIAFQPQFHRTAVIRPLPQRLTSLNSSDHSFPNSANIILPPVTCSSSFPRGVDSSHMTWTRVRLKHKFDDFGLDLTVSSKTCNSTWTLTSVTCYFTWTWAWWPENSGDVKL